MVDFSKPMGSRIVSIKTLQSAEYVDLDVNKWYKVAVAEILIKMNLGYSGLQNIKHYTVDHLRDSDVVQLYLKKNNPYHPVVEARISIL